MKIVESTEMMITYLIRQTNDYQMKNSLPKCRCVEQSVPSPGQQEGDD
jgi:hypothetical protein